MWWRVDALHACWAHVLIDQMPFMAQSVRPDDSLYFASEHFARWPHNALHLRFGAYAGARGELLGALRPEHVRFEHLGGLEPSGVRNLCMPVNESVWDCADVYPGRPPCLRRIPWTLRTAKYARLRALVHAAFGTANVSTNVTVVDRRNGRRFSDRTLGRVLEDLSSFRPVVVHFEHMTLKEQLVAVQRSRVVVCRHGAGEANFLFANPSSLHVEMNHDDELRDGRSRMYRDVSTLAGSTHRSVAMGAPLTALVRSFLSSS
jgi:hypothetical protein